MISKTLQTFFISGLLLLGGLTGTVEAQKMKIISYNVLEGMKLDTTSGKNKFSGWIKNQNPDIMVFCEMNKFTQKKLQAFARSYGHPYAVILKEGGYPEAITSKYPIINIDKVLDNMHHGFIKAEINGFNLIALHLSPMMYEKRREEIKTILATIAAHRTQDKWMIMGDFNAVSPDDKEHYADGARVKVKQAEALKRPGIVADLIDNKENDYEVIQSIKDFGLVDAIRHKNNEFISSAPAEKYKSSPNVCRIDYIFVSKDLAPKITKAEIIKDDFTKFHSDHYPVMIELKK